MLWIVQEGVEQEKEAESSVEPPLIGDMEKVPISHRGSVRLNMFESMLSPSEIITRLSEVIIPHHYSHYTDQ